MAQPEVKAGQIWQDNDPHNDRFVHIMGICDAYALVRKVECTTIIAGWQFSSKSPARLTRLSRFNGKKSGFSYIEG